MVLNSSNTERSLEKMDGFNSSDDDDGEVDTSPLKIDWLDLDFIHSDEKLGISALPGCRFKDTWRSLKSDIRCLQTAGVKDLFCFCTKGELIKYRVRGFLSELEAADITVHHHSFLDGTAPSISLLLKIVDDLKVCLRNGRKALVHCFGGYGRSCLVAVCYMMVMDESLGPEEAIAKVRDLRGPAAIQSVKQYNFVQEFRTNVAEHHKEAENQRQRETVSR